MTLYECKSKTSEDITHLESTVIPIRETRNYFMGI